MMIKINIKIFLQSQNQFQQHFELLSENQAYNAVTFSSG